MQNSRIFLTFLSIFWFWQANCQTIEDYEAFANGVLEEAELLFGLTVLTDKSVQSATSINELRNLDCLTYQLTNGNFKSIL
jgi:hypothetical protein